MAEEVEKSDMPARQTKAARGVVRRYGASMVRLFGNLFPEEKDMLVVPTSLPDRGTRAYDLMEDHRALGAYIGDKLRSALHRGAFPQDCTRPMNDRERIVRGLLLASRAHDVAFWSDVALSNMRATGRVFHEIQNAACKGCPVRTCEHWRAKSRAA